jgi:hypothetical protein
MGFLDGGYPSWMAKDAMLHDCRLGKIMQRFEPVLGRAPASSRIIGQPSAGRAYASESSPGSGSWL